jgi:hypothetical protein
MSNDHPANDPLPDARDLSRTATGAPDVTARESAMPTSTPADHAARREEAALADAVRAEDRRDLHALRDTANPGDEIGEAVGGISGVLTGAALGSLGGPIGTIIGGLAGAVSGWWAGRAISEAASAVSDEDDAHYREHHVSRGAAAPRGYDDARPAYQLGHLAGMNPDYRERAFDDVEPDLRRGWSDDVSRRHGAWDEARDYARHAYDRGRSRASAGRDMGRDNVGDHPTQASGAGLATGSSSAGMHAANAMDGGTARAIGGGVGDALTRGAGTPGGLADTVDVDRSAGDTAPGFGPPSSSDQRAGGLGRGEARDTHDTR